MASDAIADERAELSAQAVRSVVQAERTKWIALARRHVRGVVDAEDVAHRAMLVAIERAPQLRDPHRAAAWVARIVRNGARDALRRTTSADVADPETIAAPIPELTCDCILTQLDGIGERDAALLRRVVLDGQPVTSVANELGITPNAAMIRLHRARKALRDRLAKECGTTSVAGCAECGCASRAGARQ